MLVNIYTTCISSFNYSNIFITSFLRGDMNMKAAHGTVVVFLQNAAGTACWGPTPERVNELKQAAAVTPAS